MKKILLLLLVLLLYGCQTNDKTDQVDLDKLLESIELPEEVTNDLTFSDIYKLHDQEIFATWTSSNQEVISNQGKVTRPTSDVEVTITLKLTFGEDSKIKQFNLKVLKVSNPLQDLLDSITIQEIITENLNLPSTYKINDEDIIALWNSSNTNAISLEGVVTRTLVDQEVTLSLLLSSSTDTLSKDYVVTVKKLDTLEYLNNALNTITINSSSKISISLPNYLSYNGTRFTISWESSNQDALSNSGKVGLIATDTELTLKATITYEEISSTKDFTFLVIALSDEEKANYIFTMLDIPTVTSTDILLPIQFDFGLTGTWQSSNLNAMDSTGKIKPTLKGQQQTTLTLELSNNQRRTFELTVSNNNHLIIDNTFNGTKENLTVVDNKLTLDSDKLTGTYTSEIIETLNFNSAVASWAATSSIDATAELLIKVRVNGIWSKYFSYGEWGLGRKNALFNQSDTVAKLSTDEIIISNSKTADAIQFQITLRRTATSVESSRLSLVAVALNIPGYTYNVDITEIRRSVDYDVPKLYQIDVPVIGSVICSPTSSTMLLKYKGHDFSSKATYEHEYIAGLLKDYGDFNAYGNWVYNTVGMSGFGETSYVKRMYSYQELLNHLDKVGPVSASINGYVTVEKGKSYNTAGHLIVVRGYRFDDNGQLYIITNDPNLSNVHDEMKIDNFMNVWRNVIYVIE